MMYNEAIFLMQKPQSWESTISFLILENYVNGAVIQWNRIEEDKRALDRLQKVDVKKIKTLFLDIHFYFICCDKVQNLLANFAKKDGDPNLLSLWDKIKPKLKKFNDARNHLEHIETRLTEEFTFDLGNLDGDYFTFGGIRYDVGAQGLKSLTDTYEKVLDILRQRPNRKS